MKSFAYILAIIGMTAAKSLSANGFSQSQRMTVGNFTSRSKAETQVLTCYDYDKGGGDSIRAIDYIPALRNYNFDNIISSCCFTGIWILYAKENYNRYAIRASSWWAYDSCLDVPTQFDNQQS